MHLQQIKHRFNRATNSLGSRIGNCILIRLFEDHCTIVESSFVTGYADIAVCPCLLEQLPVICQLLVRFASSRYSHHRHFNEHRFHECSQLNRRDWPVVWSRIACELQLTLSCIGDQHWIMGRITVDETDGDMKSIARYTLTK